MNGVLMHFRDHADSQYVSCVGYIVRVQNLSVTDTQIHSLIYRHLFSTEEHAIEFLWFPWIVVTTRDHGAPRSFTLPRCRYGRYGGTHTHTRARGDRNWPPAWTRRRRMRCKYSAGRENWPVWPPPQPARRVAIDVVKDATAIIWTQMPRYDAALLLLLLLCTKSLTRVH